MPASSSRLRFTALLLLAVGCAGNEPAPTRGVRVENDQLLLSIEALPAPFEVTVNEGGRLQLAAGPGASLDFALGPEEAGGINLEAEVRRQEAVFASLPDGVFNGSQQLVAPIGLVFTARGSYRGENGPVEEIWGWAVHPSGNRKLTLVYSYPPGDSAARAGQLLELLGELSAPESGG